ncbi:MAG: sulfotransferase domain-containing protein [Bacteroidales bacterium]
MQQIFSNLKEGIKKRYHWYFGPYRNVAVVSYPKSGRTWLRVMLHDLKVIPVYYHDGSQNALDITYYDLPEDKSGFSRNIVIFLVRDPRDTVVSSYFQMTRRHKAFEGTISDFIRDDRYGIKKILKFHEIWHKNHHLPKDFKLIKYEDMHEDTFGVMKDLLEFLNVNRVDEDQLKKIIWFYQFNNMQKLEKHGYFKKSFKRVLYPKDMNDQESYKTRKGKVGGFHEYFSDEDIEYCNQVMKEFPNPFYRDAI